MEVLLALTRLLMRYDMINDIWRMKDIQQNIEMVTTSGGVDSCHGREWWHSDFLLLGEVLEILITKIMKIYAEDDNEADDQHYPSVLRDREDGYWF